MDALQNLNNAFEVIRSALVELGQLRDEKLTEIGKLDDAVAAVTTQLELVKQNIETERSEFEKLCKGNTALTEEAKANLTRVLQDLEVAETKLAAAEKKNVQFIAYQVRADKTLKARESSVLEREAKLEQAIAIAKRRHLILDSIT